MASSVALHKLHLHPICPVVIHSFVLSPTHSTVFVQMDTMSSHNDDDEEAGPSTLTDSAQTQQVLCDELCMENLKASSAARHKLHIHPICPVVIHSFVASP